MNDFYALKKYTWQQQQEDTLPVNMVICCTQLSQLSFFNFLCIFFLLVKKYLRLAECGKWIEGVQGCLWAHCLGHVWRNLRADHSDGGQGGRCRRVPEGDFDLFVDGARDDGILDDFVTSFDKCWRDWSCGSNWIGTCKKMIMLFEIVLTIQTLLIRITMRQQW